MKKLLAGLILLTMLVGACVALSELAEDSEDSEIDAYQFKQVRE